MPKAIFAKDVEVGDVVLLYEGEKPFAVERMEKYEDAHGVTIHGGIRHVTLAPGSIIILRHRPWPEGKTRGDTLYALAVAAEDVYRLKGYISASDKDSAISSYLEDAIGRLIQAIEAYELGKLPAEGASEDWWQSHLGPANA